MPPSKACCSHDHDCDAADCGPAYSLYTHIDQSQIRCLNELVPGSCRKVFRPWAERLQPVDPCLSSNDDDTELLLHVPFDGAVKLKAISIIGGSRGTAPAKLKVFVNRDDIDFAAAEHMPPTQEWDLQEEDPQGLLEYPTQVAKFNGVHSLDLLFTGNFGASCTEIHFIGLKGEFAERKRQAVEAVYEARAMAADHKVPGSGLGASHDVS